jgi:hypothetical protein
VNLVSLAVRKADSSDYLSSSRRCKWGPDLGMRIGSCNLRSLVSLEE